MVTIRPARTIVRTGNRFESREPTAEVRNIVIETGSILMPVSKSAQTQDELKIERDHEEHAHEDQVLREEPDQARPHRWDPSQGEVDERVPVHRLAVALPGYEPPDEHAPGRYDEQRQREAEIS